MPDRNGSRDARRINIVIAGVDEMRHQVDDFARREMIARLFVRLLVEAPD
jgi:hypothetical protein